MSGNPLDALLSGLGGLGGLGGIKAKFDEASAAASKVTATAQVGGGMVSVTANGKQEILKVKIDPSLVTSQDVTMMEDLVTAATNQALRQAKEAAAQELQRIVAGLGLPFPPGFDLSKMFGG